VISKTKQYKNAHDNSIFCQVENISVQRNQKHVL